MPTTISIKWIEAAKTLLKVESDQRLAKVFGWNRGVISAIRSGAKSLNNNECKDIAEAVRVNPLQVIADIECERAKDDKTLAYWTATATAYADSVVPVAKPKPETLGLTVSASAYLRRDSDKPATPSVPTHRDDEPVTATGTCSE